MGAGMGPCAKALVLLEPQTLPHVLGKARRVRFDAAHDAACRLRKHAARGDWQTSTWLGVSLAA